jgi:hypothetical protein
VLSAKLRQELIAARSRGTRQYVIARQAGVHPTIVSALLNAAIPIKPRDERVIRIGAVLGLMPEECFEEGAV